MEQFLKLVSRKQIVVIATGLGILQAQDFDTVLVIAGVGVIYMVLDVVKQVIIEIARTKT